MAPSPSNNNKNENNPFVVDMSSSDEELPDFTPSDPNNPYDYQHYLPGGIYENQTKRKHSSSSEGSDTPAKKKPTMPSSAAVQETTPKREAERPATTAPPIATFRNTPLPPINAVPGNAARVNPQAVQPNIRIPENAARANPQPVQPNMRNPENSTRVPPHPVQPHPQPPPTPLSPNPFTQPLAFLYASSPSYRNLLFELKSEKSRHATKLKHLNEIHAMEEQLSQAKHTADMRRLQEIIIRENGYRREAARFEREVERERHEQIMGVLGRQIAAEQREMRERAGVREDGSAVGGGGGRKVVVLFCRVG